MDTNHLGEKRKRRSILGWVAVIVGGLFTLFGLLILIVVIYDVQPDLYPHLLLGVPCFLLGIPLLILGIRRIKNAGDIESSLAENIARKDNKQLIWSWVWALVGGLITLFGVFTLDVYLFAQDSTDWYLAILQCPVPILLLGIPLLIISIRRIKKVEGNEELNAETIALKNKIHGLWGWVATIVGGLFMFIGIYFLLFVIFVNKTDGYLVILQSTIPPLLIGVPLLITGMRNKEKVSRIDKMTSETLEENQKKLRVWGWILVIVGGVIILYGIALLFLRYYSGFIVPILQGFVEPYAGYRREMFINYIFLITVPVLMIGSSLLIPGAIMLRKYKLTRQSHGRILIIMGGFYLLVTLLSIGYAVNYAKELIVFMAVYWSLFLILSVLCFVHRVKDITRTEKMPPTNIGGSDNQQLEIEVKDELHG